MAHKGIHDRGYLPHWDFKDSVQAITFRLADSLPASVINGWRRELMEELTHPEPAIVGNAKSNLHRRIARYEDAGHGGCFLKDPEYAGIVQDALLKGHGNDYKLIEWCIMPNHVHALIRMTGDMSLGSIVKRWKAATAVQINRLMESSGSIWMRDYHDRFIRDQKHFHDARIYIRNNPVKAGLCKSPEEWKCSSAGLNWDADIDPSTPLAK